MPINKVSHMAATYKKGGLNILNVIYLKFYVFITTANKQQTPFKLGEKRECTKHFQKLYKALQSFVALV